MRSLNYLSSSFLYSHIDMINRHRMMNNLNKALRYDTNISYMI